MRQIVRYCAGCHQQGIRTELSETEPDVTIVIDRYGAHTDLCADCKERLLAPVLAVMATGEGLDDLALADWAKLGQQKPTARTTRRSRATITAATSHDVADADAQASAAPVYRCDLCGQVFDSMSSLGGHRKHWGKRPHGATAPKPTKTRSAGRASDNGAAGTPAVLAGEHDLAAEPISDSKTFSHAQPTAAHQ